MDGWKGNWLGKQRVLVWDRSCVDGADEGRLG